MIRQGWQLALVTVAVLCAQADDIVFRNGRTMEDAEVKSIENGQITFTYADGAQEAKTALANVIAIRKAAASFRITKFSDHTEKKDEGKLIEIQMLSDRSRLREPVVRVFVLMQDKRGERELHVYQNQKVKDPTHLFDLPVINAKSWTPARFFVEVEDKAVAWHLEIWQDGEKVLDQDIGKNTFRRKWWLLQEPDKTSKLEIPEGVEDALGDANVRAIIRNARVRRGLDNDKLIVDCEWAIETPRDRVEMPEATFYYVTEDKDGERKLHSDRVAKDAGNEVAVQAGKVVRRETITLDSDIVLAGGGATLGGDDDEDSEKLLYWRFAVHVGDVDLAVRESPNTTVRRSLGDKWWQK
jgi:hypothetical protein